MARTKRTLQSENSAACAEENATHDETKGIASRDDDANGKRKELKLGDGEVSGKRACCSRKGKKKAEEEASSEADDKQVCVICLHEDKRRNTATLDCCSHHFCFTCINEWAKIESRCPLCKKRFRTINKHGRSKKGSEPQVIQVLERDQVPIHGPFSETYTICTECNQVAGEHLMRNCNNCGSSAHFNCTRHRGQEISGGRWHCSTCQPLAGVPMIDFQNHGNERRIIILE